MDPSRWGWWWQTGLDGLVGGILGGLATGLAVWVTIRHERRQAADVEFRAAVVRLLARLYRLGLHEDQIDLWADANVLIGLAGTREPALARDLEAFTDLLIRPDPEGVEYGDTLVVASACSQLSGRLQAWLKYPGRYKAIQDAYGPMRSLLDVHVADRPDGAEDS